MPRASVVMHRRVLKKIRNKQLPVSAIADCLKQLSGGNVRSVGLRMKRLRGIDLPVFEARVNRDIRLVFTTQPATVYREKGGNDQPRMTLVVWDVDHHDDALNRARHIDYDAVQKLDHLSLTALLREDAVEEEVQVSKLPEYPWVPISAVQQEVTPGSTVLKHYCHLRYRGEEWWLEQAARTEVESLRDAHEFCELDIARIDKELARIAESTEDFLLHLLPEQMHFVRKEGSLLLSGTVGSGKTTIMLYHLYRRAKSNPAGKYLVVTYSPTLTELCRLLFKQLPGGSELLRRVDILSYEQLLRRWFPEAQIVSYAQRRQQFAQAYRNALARWKRLDTVSKPLREWRKAHPDFWDEETLWAAYWDAVKGQLNWNTREPLDRDGYVTAVERPEQQQEHDAIYETLQTWFHLDGEDELDLSRQWWQQHETVLPMYDGVYVDEVQDLCEVQWMILLHLVRHPSGLFLTGDPFQALRPSGFHWNRLRARLQQAANVQDGSLGINLRNSRQIAGFVETELQRFKNLYALQHQPDYHVDALLEGLPPVGIEAASCPPEQVATWLSDQGALIVWDEEDQQEEFVQRCAEAGAQVVSVQEAKGLEFDRAAVYGIYGKMNRQKRTASAVQQQWAYSRLYVALTRARRGLWIIEPNGRDLPPNLSDSWREWLDRWAEAETVPVLSLQAIGETPERLEAEGAYRKAAQLYEQAQRWADAARCYEEADLYAEAGRCHENAQDFLKAAQCYVKAQDFLKAAPCYVKAEQYLEAARWYQRAEKTADAGRCYEKAGMYAEAARCYEEASNNAAAAQCYKQVGDATSVARCLAKQAERDGQPAAAARYYEQAEMHAEAGRCYTQASHYAEAAQCYERANDHDVAAWCYEQARQYPQAARCYEQAQQYSQAARCYEQDRRYLQAARCYEQAQQYSQAARCYEQAGDATSAARCLAKQAERDGQPASAARYYEQAGMYAEAGRCYEQARQYLQAALCYGQARHYLDAARCYRKLGASTSASRCLAKQAEQAGELT